MRLPPLPIPVMDQAWRFAGHFCPVPYHDQFTQVLEEILAAADPAKKGREIEIKLVARLRKHLGNPKFTELGDRLEKVKERHEQGFLTSLEFLKAMLELAKEVVEAEKGIDPVEERDRAKEALTELFNEAKGKNTHIIVERIVTDIDDIYQLACRLFGRPPDAARERSR